MIKKYSFFYLCRFSCTLNLIIVIRELHDHTKVVINTEKKRIIAEVRRGCNLSLNLFNIYTVATFLKIWKIRVNHDWPPQNVHRNTSLFADDQVTVCSALFPTNTHQD